MNALNGETGKLVHGLLGWSKLCDGEIASPEQLDANYVRRSDQIFGTPSSATPQPSTSKP